MDYTNYNCEDFLEDISFQSYIRKDREEDILFWEKWISEHPEKNNEFRKASEILTEINTTYRETYAVTKEKELERLNERLLTQKIDEDTQKEYRLTRIFKYAALILLFLGVGYMLKIMLFRSERDIPENLTAYKEIKTPKGKRLNIELSDGSRIWVNSESTIRFPELFTGNERKVYLEGEAFFDVAEDKTRPFYVYAGDVRVKVLGTTFNVRSYPEDNYTEATLERGKINIERLNSENSKEEIISMVPNQKVILYKAGYKIEKTIEKKSENEKLEKIESKNAIIATNIKTDLYTSWKDEKLVFKGETLGKLKLRLERWYNVPIVVKSPELMEKKFTGIFENEPIQEALKALSIASELEFEIKNDTVYLMHDK